MWNDPPGSGAGGVWVCMMESDAVAAARLTGADVRGPDVTGAPVPASVPAALAVKAALPAAAGTASVWSPRPI
ncbi:MAG: hypothetical protein AAB368_17195, partial [bacterium]